MKSFTVVILVFLTFLSISLGDTINHQNISLSSTCTYNLDLSVLKLINSSECWTYDYLKPVISTDAFAAAIGFSPMVVYPKESLITAILTGGEVWMLKNAIKRPRPFKVYTWDIQRAPATGYSMPSGHAAMAFEAAYLWSKRFPEFSLLFYSMATYIAVSRIYYGVHYPSDIIIGAALGYFTAYIISRAFNSKSPAL